MKTKKMPGYQKLDRIIRHKNKEKNPGCPLHLMPDADTSRDF
jgi:hypothetical protein